MYKLLTTCNIFVAYVHKYDEVLISYLNDEDYIAI